MSPLLARLLGDPRVTVSAPLLPPQADYQETTLKQHKNKAAMLWTVIGGGGLGFPKQDKYHFWATGGVNVGWMSSNYSLTSTNVPITCARTHAQASLLPLSMCSAQGKQSSRLFRGVARGQPLRSRLRAREGVL